MKEDWQQALDDIDYALGLCDELPERAEIFDANAREFLESVRGWIESHEHVTDKQRAAIQKWTDDTQKWLDR